MTEARERKMIKPGVGVQVERTPLTPTKNALTDGTYIISRPLQDEVKGALADLSVVSPGTASDLLRHPDRKIFRNAYTSIIMERIYPDYTKLVTGDDLSLYDIQFDETGGSSLHAISPERLAEMNSKQVADTIAASNQNVMTHFVCEEFKDGKIPDISGDLEKDREYHDAFQEQSALVIHSGSFFQVIPKDADAGSTFITSGLQVVRTHVFGLPNLISGVAERDEVRLTPDQHRTSFDETARGSMAHYYLPTGPLTIAINDKLIDFTTLELNPDSFTHNDNPDRFVVFPRPEIVAAVNDDFQEKDDLPVQTNCPAFHSKVPGGEDAAITVPLPRSLPEVALAQLDRWYYPKLREEHGKRNERDISTGSFVTGRFEAGRSKKEFSALPTVTPESITLNQREKNILTRLGGPENWMPFVNILQEVANVTVTEKLGPEAVVLDPNKAELQRFFRRLVVEADDVFDRQRNNFTDAITEGDESFLTALNQVNITRAGEPFFTAGEALDVFGKRMLDSQLYPPQAQGLIADDLKTFLEVAVGMAKIDSDTLNSEKVQQIKEVTNGLYAQILFDIAYGQHVETEGYFDARDRYVAANIALQYCDEVFDTFDDISEGSANLITAHAKESGEFDALVALSGKDAPSREFVLFRNPDAFSQYCHSLQTVAPESYREVWDRQQELLEIAALPPELTAKITLPTPSTVN